MYAAGLAAPGAARTWCSVRPGELAVIPRGPLARLDELEPDPLGRLAANELDEVVGVRLLGGVAGRDLRAEPSDLVRVAVDRHLGADHDAAKLGVGLSVLDLERRPRVPLEVSHLLRLRVRPHPDRPVADDVPERHEVRPAVVAVRRAGDDALLAEEGVDLLRGHGDLVAAAHGARRRPPPGTGRSGRGGSGGPGP